MSNVIFLFGPSCSGKSTLGKALQKSLGSEWSYLDRDDLIEQNVCTDSMADRTLEQKIQSIGNKIIVDAQVPWREKQRGEFYFMILPPLRVLLERDSTRTVNLSRNEKRARGAQQYVLDTHKTLKNMPREMFNSCFLSQESVTEEINVIKTAINYNSHFYVKYSSFIVVGFAFSIACVMLINLNKTPDLIERT